ncbi:alpha/beta fold hydrolase [Halopenitus persicus]|uniref:Pimeloyl-ACP methyl ester carboxylesterase n=1 Tax=Halopenitus persicus TaxID=1048396 RepID=A0A1H3KSJ0_9EURY|nr:alpha/beta hydrolase [Halopenitus persicus]SDY54738.1 Pimeloyl-ACP methyl ester carboxylesterase [Halopenitus persicus]
MPTDRPATDEPLSPPADEIPASVPGESRIRETNGVGLHVVEAGPADGELLVLLHGFPEFWYGWHAVIESLASAGFRVVVPDQRGYNLSEKPDGIAPYRIGELARDVVGLIDAYGRETALLAGHDWGAAVGWWVALHHPGRLRRFVAVNLPHPTVFRRTLRTSWRQRLRNWYILAFQLPWLPERVSRVRNWAPVVEGMRRSSRPGAFDNEDFDRYRRAWSRPGAFAGMVNWYRAVARERPTPARTAVDVPTLVVWGAGDRFLRRSMAAESLAHCSNGRLLMVHDATHWILHERPNRVARAIREHVE